MRPWYLPMRRSTAVLSPSRHFCTKTASSMFICRPCATHLPFIRPAFKPKTSPHNTKIALPGAYNHKLARCGQLNSQMPPCFYVLRQKSARLKTIGACYRRLAMQAPKKFTQAVKLRPEYRPSHPLLSYYRKVTKVNFLRSAALDIGDIGEWHITGPAGSDISGLSV
jgi:hypothetical protein